MKSEQLTLFAPPAKNVTNAKYQDDVVLTLFGMLEQAMTPSMVHGIAVKRKLISKRVPLTSIRLAMTNLTKRKRLRKTGEMTRGPYGRPEHKWKLRK